MIRCTLYKGGRCVTKTSSAAATRCSSCWQQMQVYVGREFYRLPENTNACRSKS